MPDARSSAADWLDYGEFLHRHNQSEELVFACLRHAAQLLPAASGDERNAISQALAESEARIGHAAAARVTAQLDVELRRALSLPSSDFSKTN